jgi:hypothetical protein
MNEPIQQLIDAANTVRMTDSERSNLRRTLEAYTANYRAPASAWAFAGRHVFASSLMGLLLVVGGTAAVAHRAAPDDVLYGIRLAVNDRIETLAAVSEDAQLEVELRQLNRMLDDEEFALDDELLSLADGIEEADDDDVAEDDGIDDDSGDEDESEDGEPDDVPRRSPVPSPVRFDDGADIELQSILRDLESAAQETPDMGE